MNRTSVKKTKTMFAVAAISFSMFVSVACTSDKTSQMKDEIAAAYAAAAEGINAAQDETSAKQVSEQLQTTLSEIQVKYKDVVEDMSNDEKTTIASFCKEQRDKMYENANESGKKLIDGISSATNDAFGAAITSVSDAEQNATDVVDNVKDALGSSSDSIKNAAENVKNAAIEKAESYKDNAKTKVDEAKESVKNSANKKVEEAQKETNDAINAAASKAKDKLNKGLNKALGE